jgi:rubrerythrin
MIFIAGVSPRIKVLDQNPHRCPACGLKQAFYKRIDHYFSLFFIPIFRVKTGEPFLVCDHCEQSVHPTLQDSNWQQSEDAWVCRYCGKTLNTDFKYCPHCGKRV